MAGSTSPGRFVVPKTITGRDRSVAEERDKRGAGRGGTTRGGAGWDDAGRGGEGGIVYRRARAGSMVRLGGALCAHHGGNTQ